MAEIRLNVSSERGTYPVVIGAGTTTQLPALLKERSLDAPTIVVTCPPVWRLHGRRLRPVLGRHTPVVLPDGERAKTLAIVGKIYDAMLKRRLDRSGVLLAFGGGVVGDTAGFAAATYLRGVRLVQVPTTLLAQVDSAIGGKVGVNLAAGKNLVGAFHAPSLVVCDPLLLATLPRREFRAGLYEVVKYGVIAWRPLFDRVSTNLAKVFDHDSTIATSIVSDCCRIKADVVMSDEREAGPRRVLNFGHTVGHALEAVTRYRRFLHGEAVAYGMLAAAHISAARGLFPSDDHAQLRDLIVRMGPLPAVADLRTRDLIAAIERDKKVVNGRLHFVATTAIGSTAIVSDVQTSEIKNALREIGVRR